MGVVVGKYMHRTYSVENNTKFSCGLYIPFVTVILSNNNTPVEVQTQLRFIGDVSPFERLLSIAPFLPKFDPSYNSV